MDTPRKHCILLYEQMKITFFHFFLSQGFLTVKQFQKKVMMKGSMRKK